MREHTKEFIKGVFKANLILSKNADSLKFDGNEFEFEADFISRHSIDFICGKLACRLVDIRLESGTMCVAFIID